MTLYYLVFVIAFFYFLISSKKLQKNSYLLAAFLLYVAIFVGLGDMIGGYDRYIYGEAFDTIANETRGRQNYANVLYLVDGAEYGYFGWELLVSVFTSNRYWYILSTTIMMYVLYFLAIRKYVDNYPLACIVFLGVFYYFTITYLRQTIAVGIAWQGVKYIWERNPWKFFSITLLAFLFHNSAGIFFIMYFIPIKKYSKDMVLGVLITCLLLGISPLPVALLAGAESTTGKEGYSESEIVGFRWEYALEVIFFVWIFFKCYHLIPKDKKTLTFLNMSFVFCAILIIFIRFGQGGRFGWYFFIGIIYMLTSLSYRRGGYKWMKPFTVALCLVLFLRVSLSWAFNLSPYKTFLTNGLPSGAYYIYERYEYDSNYTLDKLYRD